MGEKPPSPRAAVEAVLGPLTDLPPRKARLQAKKLRALLLSRDPDARAQGLELLGLCGDWPTLAMLSELVTVSVAGEVLPAEGTYPEDTEGSCVIIVLGALDEDEELTREVAFRLASFGGLLADAPRLTVPAGLARGMGPVLLQLAPAAQQVDIPLGQYDRLELLPLPGAALLASPEALFRVPYDTLGREELLAGDFLGGDRLLRAGAVHLAVGEDQLCELGDDGVPAPPGPERGLGLRGRQLFAVDEETALLADGTWLYVLARREARARARHRFKEASVLAALPSGPLLAHAREDGTAWYPRPGGTRRRLELGFEPVRVQRQGTLALLLPEDRFGVSGRYAVVDLQTGEWKAHALPPDLAPRALLEDGRVFACSRQKQKAGAVLQLWPGLGDAPPRALPPPHATRVKAWLPLPGGRLITASMEGAVLWDTRTCERRASTRQGAVALSLLEDGRVACGAGGGETSRCWSAEDLSPAGTASTPSVLEWQGGGLRFVYDNGALTVRMTRETCAAWLRTAGNTTW